MRHIDLKLPSMSGSGTRYQLQLDTGVTYKELVFCLKNVEPENIKRVKVVKDGDSIIDVSGDFLMMLQKYKKRWYATDGSQNTSNDTDWLVLPFADFEMLNQKSQNISGFVTLPLENIFVKLELDGTVPNADITVRAVTAPNPIWGRLYLPRMYEDIIPCNHVGEIRSRSFVEQNKTGNSVAIRRAHLQSTAIDEFSILQDEKVVHEKTAKLNKYDILREEFAPQDGFYHFDPVKTRFGFVDKLITDGGSFEMRLKVTEAKDIKVIYEVIEFVGTQANVEAALAAGYGQVW